ncbi:MAG: radical SAM protein [Oscillospiraceae bacterium]|nr:radical SAM protein [Oscillospiraceae bacterium]
MVIDKSEEKLRTIIDDWAKAYFDGEIYGFGLSDEIGFATFFDNDMGEYEPTAEDMENLHNLGFRADTHRMGRRAGRGFQVKAVFDNNSQIHNTVQIGMKVLPPYEIPNMGKMKIAIFPRRYYSIKRQLESYGLKEYEDFIYYNFFVALYNYFAQNKVLIWKATVAMTTRCALKCKDCNMFIPYYKEQADIPFEELASDLDLLFNRIDYVQWYAILGGDPLLNPRLVDYLNKMKKYSNRIAEIVIDTNGSTIPEDSLLECTKELGNARIMVNNYRIDAQYAETYDKVVKKLKNSGVSYTLREYDWSQYKRQNKINDENELKRHYIRCNQAFTAIQSKRLYTCHLPWSAAQCGIGPDDLEDSLDLSSSSVTALDIVKAGLGHIPRGYTSRCSMCNGCDPDYYEKIPKAVQL